LRRMVTPQMAEAAREAHPMRAQMASFASDNPAMKPFAEAAETAREERKSIGTENVFVRTETAMADLIERNWDLYRDGRDAMIEMSFHAIYAHPLMRAIAPPKPEGAARHDIQKFPEVRAVLAHIDEGGYPEAIVRMMILMGRARGSVRRERLERANALLHNRPPFDTMTESQRTHIIHEQSMIVDLAQAEALATLPKLLRDDVDRIRALNLVLDVAGPPEDMDAPTIAMFDRFQTVLRARARDWVRPTSRAGKDAAE